MAIGHKDIAIRRNGYPGRLIEGVGPTSLYALLAECHQHRTSRTKLENLVAPRDAIRPFGGQPEHRLSCIGVACPRFLPRRQ